MSKEQNPAPQGDVHDSGTAPVLDEHSALQEVNGEWFVETKQWTAARSTPLINHGRMVSRSILGGLGQLITHETRGEVGPYQGIGVFTWNIQHKRYDGVWLDSASRSGIQVMWGRADRGMSRAGLVSKGKVATRERVHSANITPEAGACPCLPGNIEEILARVNPNPTEAAAPPAGGPLTLNLVENRVSADHWILEFYVGSTLVMQNTYTRPAGSSSSLHDVVGSALQYTAGAIV